MSDNTRHVMMSTSDAPGCEDISEARGYDELVVEEFFDAATDDEDSDVAEYSTGDETEGGPDDTQDDAVDDAHEAPEVPMNADAVADANSDVPEGAGNRDDVADGNSDVLDAAVNPDDVAHGVSNGRDDAGDENSEVPVDSEPPPPAPPAWDEEKKKHYAQMKKNFNRGIGGKNQVGKTVRYGPPIRVKRFAVNLFRNGEDSEEIRKTIWNRTREKFLLVNKRLLNGWVKIVDKLGDCVVQQTSKRVAGGGRKVRFAKYDTALCNWFCARRTEKHSVSASLLKDEAQRLAKADGRTISQRWLEKFRNHHNIVI